MRGRLDTGAGMTVIPEELPAQLGLSPHGQTWTTSFDGSRTNRDVYYVGVRVEGFSLPSVRCVVANRGDVLLGRNVLNNFLITLDGKNLAFDLQNP
jgi:predicted aspartyl protease